MQVHLRHVEHAVEHNDGRRHVHLLHRRPAHAAGRVRHRPDGSGHARGDRRPAHGQRRGVALQLLHERQPLVRVLEHARLVVGTLLLAVLVEPVVAQRERAAGVRGAVAQLHVAGGDAHLEFLACKLEAIHGRHRLAGLRGVLELHEGKALALVGVGVAVQVDKLDLAKGREELLQLFLGDVRQRVREAAHVQPERCLTRRVVEDGLLGGLRCTVLFSLRGLDPDRLALHGLPAEGQRLQRCLLEVELHVGQALGSSGPRVADNLHIADLPRVG
mmetsp:Transcript_37382/g.116186  ORF Transcript_37382/g.116186 Transcript_37382/m.116186 type:complete len:274 (+) Transcript_37382:360-1181(+)